MKAFRIILLILSLFVSASCVSKPSEKLVTIDYRGQQRLRLDMSEEHMKELLEAIEIASIPIYVNGRIANVRPANNKNLNGYAICIQTTDGKHVCGFLHNNMPFSIAEGRKEIYNFKHLLSERDLITIYEMIPSWKNK